MVKESGLLVLRCMLIRCVFVVKSFVLKHGIIKLIESLRAKRGNLFT